MRIVFVVFKNRKNMAVSWTSVLSICFLVGTTSTAPALTSSSSKDLIKNLEILYLDLQNKCDESQLKECGGKDIREVNFSGNCTQAVYQNMFCEVQKALKEFKHASCKGVVPNITIPNSLLKNKGNCGSSSPQDRRLALKDFCSRLNMTVDHMFRNCYI